MKDLRCLLGMHTWQKKQIEDSQYLVCRRFGKDRPAAGHSPTPFGAGGAG